LQGVLFPIPPSTGLTMPIEIKPVMSNLATDKPKPP
jgi:hypothetical protein